VRVVEIEIDAMLFIRDAMMPRHAPPFVKEPPASFMRHTAAHMPRL